MLLFSSHLTNGSHKDLMCERGNFDVQLLQEQVTFLHLTLIRHMKSNFCILYSVFQEVTHVHSTESRGKGPSN